MAGHSQFKNIMHRKGAQDKKRAKVFTKLIREITVSAKTGLPDPQANPRLRAAISAARIANMPKDTIDRAIKKAIGGDDSATYEEIRYEGYGPAGVAVIVEVLTDNRNRAASEVRAAFSKYAGALGETNSVSFMFDRLGLITYPVQIGDYEKVFEASVEAGADDLELNDDIYEITCAPDDLNQVRENLEKTFGESSTMSLTWRPKTLSPVNEKQAETLIKLIDVLEDNDDVQDVFANYDMPAELIEKLSK
ncbi:MAG: YebC/PmpR family DNA-binding transcriptional regulator [Alphaproteobacteria bacterium]|nr:YebC/PmpR family DNA-binding transcriptional regulator [Alphaproteobacteria bacterium]